MRYSGVTVPLLASVMIAGSIAGSLSVSATRAQPTPSRPVPVAPTALSFNPSNLVDFSPS
jgi:hypothetical protein